MRSILTACILASAVGAAAGQDARPVAPSEQGKPVLLSGCLEGGPSNYTLAMRPVARLPHERADVPIGTSGTSMSYTLTPRDEVDLSRHVGKKVEIRGSLMPAGPTPAPALSASQASSSSAGKPSEQREPRVKRDDSPDVKPESEADADSKIADLIRPGVSVTSVRVVSVSCR